jgi:hypothetical protein
MRLSEFSAVEFFYNRKSDLQTIDDNRLKDRKKSLSQLDTADTNLLQDTS